MTGSAPRGAAVPQTLALARDCSPPGPVQRLGGPQTAAKPGGASSGPAAAARPMPLKAFGTVCDCSEGRGRTLAEA